jgi:hypothetical protein
LAIYFDFDFVEDGFDVIGVLCEVISDGRVEGWLVIFSEIHRDLNI